MVDRSVLVSGGGIAGSTAAYWLAKAGWSVTIVERAADTRSSGNPIDVRGGAVAIARQMGIWSRLEEAATGVERLVFVDADGRPQATIRTRQRVDRHEEVEVARNELVGLLLEKAQETSLIIRDDSITALHQDGGGIDVEFQRTPSRRFDLVVGSDGLHSTVRRLAFGPEERFSRPFGMFVGTVRAPAPIQDPRTVLLYNEPGTSLTIHPAGGKPGFAFIFRGSTISTTATRNKADASSSPPTPAADGSPRSRSRNGARPTIGTSTPSPAWTYRSGLPAAWCCSVTRRVASRCSVKDPAARSLEPRPSPTRLPPTRMTTPPLSPAMNTGTANTCDRYNRAPASHRASLYPRPDRASRCAMLC